MQISCYQFGQSFGRVGKRFGVNHIKNVETGDGGASTAYKDTTRVII